MKLYFVTDMEGVAGVLDWHHSEGKYVPLGNQLLIDEIKAAMAAARACGAEHITLFEGHHTADLHALADDRTRVAKVQGQTWPFELDDTFDAVCFVGQHAMAGTAEGHLSHTFAGGVSGFRVNGRNMGEFGIWTMLAASFGVPVIFLSGDVAACEEARAFVPNIEAAAVKQGLSVDKADHLSPADAHALIDSRMRAAMAKLARGEVYLPRVDKAWSLDVSMHRQRIVRETWEVQPDQPQGVSRVDEATVRIEHASLVEALKLRRGVKFWKTTGPWLGE